MKRIVWSARALALALTVSSLGAGTVVAKGPPGLTGAALEVKLSEWSLGFSRINAKSGKIAVQVTGGGRFPHDFVVRKKGTGEVVYKSPILRGSQTATANLDLPSGQYELYCSLPGHRARGMYAALTVGG